MPKAIGALTIFACERFRTGTRRLRGAWSGRACPVLSPLCRIWIAASSRPWAFQPKRSAERFVLVSVTLVSVPPRMPCHVLVDFDGTIATVDTTDALLERFALPEWHAIEDEWKAGKIGSRECMVRQIDLVRATPDELDAFIETIEIDPGVPAFFADARARGLEISVVSDGLDRTVNAVLARSGIIASTRANHLEYAGDSRWRLTFPNTRADCRALSGNCKCATPNAAETVLRVVVGDGRSDFCVAEQADFVLAKSKLVDHARSRNLPHASFATFAEAKAHLAAWLDGAVAPSRTSAAHVRCDASHHSD
jgi:2-hydroxy-3-keto-5-methylthiopentenyl-1-phosphate phosphatase